MYQQFGVVVRSSDSEQWPFNGWKSFDLKKFESVAKNREKQKKSRH